MQEEFYGRELTLADRELVEQNSGNKNNCTVLNITLLITDVILQSAATEDVAFLVVGDPLG